MQRYFVEKTIEIGEKVTITGSNNHHIQRVMRTKVGDFIVLVGINQKAFKAEIINFGKDSTDVLIKEEIDQASELPVSVTIACGLSKNNKLDFIVQKGTELGMDTFIPLKLRRNVVKWEDKKISSRVERLQTIAYEASRQSKRLKIPTVKELVDINGLITLSKDYTYCLVAYEEVSKDRLNTDKYNLVNVLEKIKEGESLLVVFGSEGGLDEEEVETLVENGFISCSLGHRILRAETAPLYLLSAVSYELELKGK